MAYYGLGLIIILVFWAPKFLYNSSTQKNNITFEEWRKKCRKSALIPLLFWILSGII